MHPYFILFSGVASPVPPQCEDHSVAPPPLEPGTFGVLLPLYLNGLQCLKKPKVPGSNGGGHICRKSKTSWFKTRAVLLNYNLCEQGNCRLYPRTLPSFVFFKKPCLSQTLPSSREHFWFHRKNSEKKNALFIISCMCVYTNIFIVQTDSAHTTFQIFCTKNWYNRKSYHNLLWHRLRYFSSLHNFIGS